ncbi:DciA family protein [Gleimia sp. 6138-11-ORH1]|uniref:DciA family protein n=1 Tax=Gleimia sp. 6138-11-ORH1 TaxID=2973937 RepID=UPI0021679C86|nr:DUF721 domain-containing protein [Gleimia sp. 6138-11-ORH1]MCS4485126.1 DciA family protein [Gleimia sp. 6138-11-ORH1]
MPEENPSVNEYALQALERQQAAARRKGYFPTGVASPKIRRTAAETEINEGTELHQDNLRTLRFKNSPGLARADLLSARDIPKQIGQVMQRLIANNGWQTQLSIAALSQNWSEVVGVATAAHCWVDSFDPDKNLLCLGTDSQVWANQLRLLLPQIEAKISTLVGDSVIQQVIILGPEATARRNPGQRPGLDT